MADPERRQSAESKASFKGDSLRALRAPILIVDDHPANLLAFEAVLQDHRHELLTAASGREALALAEKTEFAAILLDVRMPDLNGYDTAAVLRRRSRTRSTPILFMTAFDASPQEVSEAYAIGGTDFIRKPVDEVMLRSKIGVYVDLYFDRIEAREWAKELTETAERRLRVIFEQMPVSLFTVNRDLRVTFADGRHVRAEGRVGGEVIGRRVTEFVSEEERPKVEKAFRDALEGRAASYETRSGASAYSAHVQPLTDRDKSVIGAICGFLDVTEQRAAEREVLAHQHLREALEESDAFARNVSHELRAPLRAMGFCAQALFEDLDPFLDAEHKGQFERLIQAAQRLDAMTQDLLTYSRLARTDLILEPVSPGAILGELMARMEADLCRQGACIRLEGPFPEVQGHRLSLEHALSNLLYNAVKFVAPGMSPDVVVRPETRGPLVRLWVEDNGIGISSEDQGRLFRVFERLAPKYPGTGVGLAIVRKCVERMRGKVGVESRPGGGSRFYVELPAART
jgi:PAS domain S-box-containing protein